MLQSRRNDDHQGVSAEEADPVVDELSCLQIDEIGSDSWSRLHKCLEKLNIQAHLNVQLGTEEFVSDLIIKKEKMRPLIQILLVSEIWKAKVFPHILRHVKSEYVTTLYFTLFHEATIVNILDVIFNVSSDVFATSEDDLLVEVVDYCMRKVAFLNSWEDHELDDKPEDAKVSDEEQLRRHRRELDFSISISALSILRSITDHITDVPVSVVGRILKTHDVICSCVMLMEKTPWIRRIEMPNSSGNTGRSKRVGLLKFEKGQWKELAKEEAHIIPKVEAQVWLILYNLMIEPVCRQVYEYTTSNQSTIVKLKPYLTQMVVDQIPPLVDLLRHLEELSITNIAPHSAMSRSHLLIEQVPMIRSEIIDSIRERMKERKGAIGKDVWKAVADQFMAHLEKTSSKDRLEAAKSFAELYDLSQLDLLLDDPKCGKCGQLATQRCSRCKMEWYCGRACQVNSWTAHKPICDLLSSDAASRAGEHLPGKPSPRIVQL
ncbi:hypothetical protein BJ742DRAFT_813693 [Cladochytrium replicatum]|nr:hypothetical protein BJ742DRAFT_813693 [Cladochytrium replicatum]